MPAPAATILAHGGGVGHEAGEAAMAAIAVAAMVIPLLAIALIGRAFYRAAKRDAEGPSG